MLKTHPITRAVTRALAMFGLGLATIIVPLGAPAAAQSQPSRLQGPVIEEIPTNVETLQKERFRRRAAEAAQKQMERLADQLRQQLVTEVAARKSAEAALNSMIAKIKLTDEIDQQRKHLYGGKVAALETRRDALERDNLRLSQQLNEEIARRQQLEARLEQVLNSGKQSKLALRVEELERALNTARWARKLAEAQLELVAARLKQKSSP